MHIHGNINVSLTLLLALALAACGRDDGGTNVGSANADRSATIETAGQPALAVPGACTFYSRAELESAVGWELREGVPEDVPAGSGCAFESPPGMYVTRTFPNPALPRSVGFSGLTVTTYPSPAGTFAQGRDMPGAEAVPNLGDDSYFNGPNLLQVRVGRRGFSVRIYTDATSHEDWAKVRAVMLALGRTGAARL